MMLVVRASDTGGAVFSYAFGGFYLAIAVACVARGRVAQSFGSLVALTIVALGIWYVTTMLGAGLYWSASHGEPSLRNAVAFLTVFVVPSPAYLWRARFGLRRSSVPEQTSDLGGVATSAAEPGAAVGACVSSETEFLMKWRFIGLSALSLAPWAYLALATRADLWSRMAGFGLLPFAALLLARTMAFTGRDVEAEPRRVSGRSVSVSVALALLLAAAVVYAGGWLGNTRSAVRTGAVLLLVIGAAASVAWDIRRGYLRTLAEVPPA